jgi:DNA-binding transcriptional LysR family regulator
MLLEHIPPTIIAKRLGLTPPAISHRIKKIKQTFDIEVFVEINGRRKLTEESKPIFVICSQALSLILESEK